MASGGVAATRRSGAPRRREREKRVRREEAAGLVRVLEFDAGGLNVASEVCEFVGSAEVLYALEAVSRRALRAVGASPISLRLTAAMEARPLEAMVAAHPARRALRAAWRGDRRQLAGFASMCPHKRTII